MPNKAEPSSSDDDRNEALGPRLDYEPIIDDDDAEVIRAMFDEIATNKLQSILALYNSRQNPLTSAVNQHQLAEVSRQNKELLAERQGLLEELGRRMAEIAALESEGAELRVDLCLTKEALRAMVQPR